MDNLVEEMKEYKNNVIRKIRQSQNKYRNIDYRLKRKDNNLILTPLAEKEKEKSLMGRIKKEQFNTAERIGVAMRRIEYTYLLDQNGHDYNEDAVTKIKKCFSFHKNTIKRRIVKGLILLKKYIKRKLLNLLLI